MASQVTNSDERPTVSIDDIRKGVRIGERLLDAYDRGEVTDDDLAAVQMPTIKMPEINLPSDAVVQAVAASRKAREAYKKETDIRKAISVAGQVLAAIGRSLPVLGSFLSRTGAVVLLCCVLGLAGGCRADAALDADVAGVDASRATSQPATADSDQQAGRDARQTVINLTVSGSAWPIVAAGGLALATVLTMLWVRANFKARDESARRRDGALTAEHAITRAKTDYGTLVDNSMHVAGQIANMPEAARDELLKEVRNGMPNKPAWDQLLGAYKVRCHVTHDNAGSKKRATSNLN